MSDSIIIQKSTYRGTDPKLNFEYKKNVPFSQEFQNNNGNLLIEVYTPDKDATILKSDLFTTEIIIGNSSIPMCKRKAQKQMKPVINQSNCEETEGVFGKTITLISNKLKMDNNPLNTYILNKKTEKIALESNLQLLPYEQAFQKLNIQGEMQKIRNDLSKIQPFSGGKKGGGDDDLFRILFFCFYRRSSGTFCYILAHIIFLITCIAPPHKGCLGLGIMIALDLLIALLILVDKGRQDGGANVKPSPKKFISKVITNSIFSYNNFKFFEIGNIVSNSQDVDDYKQTIMKIEEFQKTMNKNKKKGFFNKFKNSSKKKLFDIFGNLKPAPYKVQALDDGYRYFMGVRFNPTTGSKLIPRTYVSIPFIVKMKEEIYTTIRNLNNQFAVIISASLVELPVDTVVKSEQTVDKLVNIDAGDNAAVASTLKQVAPNVEMMDKPNQNLPPIISMSNINAEKLIQIRVKKITDRLSKNTQGLSNNEFLNAEKKALSNIEKLIQEENKAQSTQYIKEILGLLSDIKQANTTGNKKLYEQLASKLYSYIGKAAAQAKAAQQQEQPHQQQQEQEQEPNVNNNKNFINRQKENLAKATSASAPPSPPPPPPPPGSNKIEIKVRKRINKLLNNTINLNDLAFKRAEKNALSNIEKMIKALNQSKQSEYTKQIINLLDKINQSQNNSERKQLINDLYKYAAAAAAQAKAVAPQKSNVPQMSLAEEAIQKAKIMEARRAQQPVTPQEKPLNKPKPLTIHEQAAQKARNWAARKAANAEEKAKAAAKAANNALAKVQSSPNNEEAKKAAQSAATAAKAAENAAKKANEEAKAAVKANAEEAAAPPKNNSNKNQKGGIKDLQNWIDEYIKSNNLQLGEDKPVVDKNLSEFADLFEQKSQETVKNLFSLKTVGDGSCFIHSLFQSVSDNYRKLNNKDKSSVAVDFRVNILANMENNEYKSESGFTIKPNKIKEYKNNFANPNYYLQNQEIILISNKYKLNFLFFVLNTKLEEFNKRDIQQIYVDNNPDNKDKYYWIYIYNADTDHYETIRYGDDKYYFTSKEGSNLEDNKITKYEDVPNEKMRSTLKLLDILKIKNLKINKKIQNDDEKISRLILDSLSKINNEEKKSVIKNLKSYRNVNSHNSNNNKMKVVLAENLIFLILRELEGSNNPSSPKKLK